MPATKKYGSFAGVFTPSLLTILGVIMYMRLGWVVGNAGLWGSLIIILIAHIISFTTGLSISSIATDKKVGAGGVYYVLSRSLGMPIGGAIGLTLFVGTAFSIALYLIGFSESLNAYLGFDTSLDGYRITAGIALLLLTILAFISTSIALKAQFIILLAIVLSLVSIFMGERSFAPETVSTFGDATSVPFETVFAIFFPAVTGFTAGIAMSGDLKDPKSAIPKGTMASIIVGLLVYIFLAIFIAYTINPQLLQSDNTILIKIAWFSPLVVAGIWGATLSSALGGILGGPRILQAMSLDKITPKLFAKGAGKNKEPRLALIFTVILAGTGILIGELNMIARIVSMFYLAAYGFINLSFFLESWASSDFRPAFKVNKWIGFVGFIVTFIIMFKLDMLAMFMAFVIIGGIYFWLSKKEFSAGEGDVWQSVWTNIIKKGLKTLNAKEEHKRNWKPNILLFSGKSNARQYLLEFSRFLAGKSGIVTNFDLTENKKPGELFSKDKQSYQDEMLVKYGVFGRQLEVNNLYKGMETIASVFGFSGIEPNTILMGWARNSKDPVSFAKMTASLMKLDYNVLYLDYDKEKGFGKYQTIDLWWRGISRNAELTLMLVKSLVLSNEWRRAKTMIILVNNTGEDQQLIKKRIEHLIISFRVAAEVFIINNYTENKSIYDLMKIHSGNADLIMLGIPDIRAGEEDVFVKNVNNLVDVLGTTLLVKASSEFEIADLGLHKPDISQKISNLNIYLPVLQKPPFKDELFAIEELEKKLSKPAIVFETGVINPVIDKYLQTLAICRSEIETILNEKSGKLSGKQLIDEYSKLLVRLGEIINDSALNDMHLLYELVKSGIDDYLSQRKKIIESSDKKLTLSLDDSELVPDEKDLPEIKKLKEKLLTKKTEGKPVEFSVQWRKIVEESEKRIAYEEFNSLLLYLLDIQLETIQGFTRKLNNTISSFVEKIKNKTNGNAEKEFETELTSALDNLQKELLALKEKSLLQLKYINREVINDISSKLIKGQHPGFALSGNKQNKFDKVKLANINDYPDLWYQAIVPFLSGIKVSFWLNSLYLDMLGETDYVKIKIEENIKKNIEKIFPDIETMINKISNGIDTNDDFVLKLNDVNSGELLIREDKLLGQIYSFLESHLKYIPDSVDVLTPECYTDIIKKQIEEIETVSLPLDKIVKYIISSNLINPLKEKLTDFNQSLKAIKLKLNSIINILNYISISTEQADDTKTLIENVKFDFNTLKDDYYYKTGEFNEYVIQILHQLNLNLNLDNISENIGEFNKFIKKDERGKIGKYFRNAGGYFSNKIYKIFDFIATKNEDVRRIEYRKENEKYIPQHLRLKNEVEKYMPSKPVLKNLPFYYLQLFKGSRFAIPEKNGEWEFELNNAKKSIVDLADGNNALLVAGESGIGKSGFLDKLAGELNAKVPVYFDAIDYLGKSKFPFKHFLSDFTGQKGNISTILSKFPVGTVIVIEDIENYISYKEGGKPLLDLLSEMVVKFGDKYYFLFSTNINSMQIIGESSDLLNNLTSVTVLHPLQDKYIEKIILGRHKMGNLTLYANKENELSTGNIREIIAKITDVAEGNPGVALTLWLSLIEYGNDKFYMDTSRHFDSLDIKNKYWLSLLQRLIVFGNISIPGFKEFSSSVQLERIKKDLLMLHKAGILEHTGKDGYRINRFLKPFIERLLKSKEII